MVVVVVKNTRELNRARCTYVKFERHTCVFTRQTHDNKRVGHIMTTHLSLQITAVANTYERRESTTADDVPMKFFGTRDIP